MVAALVGVARRCVFDRGRVRPRLVDRAAKAVDANEGSGWRGDAPANARSASAMTAIGRSANLCLDQVAQGDGGFSGIAFSPE